MDTLFDNAFMDRNMNFYIHAGKTHIGNRLPGRAINFAAKKREMSQLLKGQYKTLLNHSLSSQSLSALSQSMDISQDKLINLLDKELRTQLQSELSVNKLQTLFNIVNTNNLNHLLNNVITEEGKANVANMQKALEVIEQCVNLLEGRGANLGACLSIAAKEGTLAGMGAKLAAELMKWQKQNNLQQLPKDEVLKGTFNQLNNLAIALQGKFKSGKELTTKGLVTLVSHNLISTNLAEGLAAAMKADANSILHDTIAQNVGARAYVVDDIGKDKSKKIVGKTDILLPNVKVRVGTNKHEIQLNVGISSKFYTGQAFLGNTKKMSGSFGSGSGGTLKEALQAIFPAAEDRYLAYNYMVHDVYTMQMNDLIATRQLLRLFATSGASADFSQYMLVNGKVISIWQIVKYAMSTNLGLSNSMGGSKSQGVVLSIPDRKSFKKRKTQRKGMSPEAAAWMRSRQQNSAINKARITATLHMQNLAKMVS